MQYVNLAGLGVTRLLSENLVMWLLLEGLCASFLPLLQTLLIPLNRMWLGTFSYSFLLM